MSGHLLAFEHATRRLTLADRARGAMRQRVTVGGATTAKIPALLHAGKAFALRDAGDVNSLHAVELTHLDLGTVLQILAFAIGETDFPETTAGGNRSEEHTSELQSLMRTSYAGFCLNKKKTPYN